MSKLVAVLAGTALAATLAGTARGDPAADGTLAVSDRGRIVVDGRVVARGTSPAWSPDGRRPAYARNGHVFVAEADGSDERRLTRPGRSLAWPARAPAWSPDGTTIAFAGTRDLFTVRVADRRLRAVTRSDESWRLNTTPAWSPDGRTIAFSRSTDAFNSDIFLVRPDGGGLRRLTRTHGTHDVLGEETMPDWSPDGRTLAFVTNRDGNFELYAIDVRSGREVRITDTPRSFEEGPRYDRTGKRLLYVHEGRVASIRTDGTGVRELGRGSSADWR